MPRKHPYDFSLPMPYTFLSFLKIFPYVPSLSPPFYTYNTPKSKIFQAESKKIFVLRVDILLLAIYNNFVLKAQFLKKVVNLMALLLKAARLNAEKTLGETAEKVGKTKMTILNYERYKSVPDVKTAYKIAEFYGVGIDDIVWSK
jgi:DNA-binding XRE family transcriptional regulator